MREERRIRARSAPALRVSRDLDRRLHEPSIVEGLPVQDRDRIVSGDSILHYERRDRRLRVAGEQDVVADAEPDDDVQVGPDLVQERSPMQVAIPIRRKRMSFANAIVSSTRVQRAWTAPPSAFT